eukprot:m.7667 g.7667  ORF g.7667 m.7667 type:complete len:623 (+) comp3751_c1_seq1:270-2138(+)
MLRVSAKSAHSAVQACLRLGKMQARSAPQLRRLVLQVKDRTRAPILRLSVRAFSEANVAAKSPRALIAVAAVGVSSVVGLSVAYIKGITPQRAYDFLYDWLAPPPPEQPIRILQPTMITPDAYVHPYSLKPWYWRWAFTFRRAMFLLSIFLPFLMDTAFVYFLPGDEEECKKRMEEWTERLLDVLNRGGCSFVKFGQWISMRPDMFPRVVVDALAKLRQDVPPHSYEDTIQIIEGSFGCDAFDIFEWIDEECLASGSVAQVHRCKLRSKYALVDGSTDAVIKVRHPKVLDDTFMDIHLIFAAIPFINFFAAPYGIKLSIPFAQSEFHNVIQKQLDFQWEAWNLVKFSRNFAKEINQESNAIRFPYVSVDLVSEEVLVEGFAPGKTVSSLFDRAKDPISEQVQHDLAESIFEMTIKMFLRDNFIHGDLHAGNLLYDRQTGRVTVLDAGLVTNITDDMFDHFGDFLRALVTQDTPVIADKLILFHDKSASQKPVDIDRDQLIKTINWIYTEGGGKRKPGVPVAQAMGDIVGDILRKIPSFGVILRGDIAASLSTISIAEGLIMQLCPEFDMLTNVVPYFVRYRGWVSANEIWDYGYSTVEKNVTAPNPFNQTKEAKEETTENRQ